eukprot:CAMPEP_0201592048 /NCGR_PEP_ID=MMETSP0190_2-20130828/190047_1 /ASSEMBLY_ACC=CAM_ASM_000263 /TAXON_ID=37353 /ORGANISM="Rosalina sp." /LENGTH=549 /DNA_ID=CAMNT_0048050637 /DNA_START=79 /DNA_END=1728 /DNA_ORIENTATION=+
MIPRKQQQTKPDEMKAPTKPEEPAVDKSVLTELKDMGYDLANVQNDELRDIIKRLESNITVRKSETQRLKYHHKQTEDRLNENKDKIKKNQKAPYLVSNVIEILDESKQDQGEDEEEKNQSVVIRTSTRENVLLSNPGLVDSKELRPNTLVGVDKDSYVILDKLPTEHDLRVKAMEVDQKPEDSFNSIGGLDKQIEELSEAIILPILHKELFEQIGIDPPKGVLLYGPPGTGKTLLARACAHQTNATFLKLAGTQLVQAMPGDGAKIVRDAFALAKEKAPTIIFIDELDAIGTKRFDSDKSGDREVQRTMLELLNQLDGFSSDVRIKVIAATNRTDILDPALLRSGRIDRKVECPLPNELARERILKIHATKMNYHQDVNFKELSRCCEDFNGAQLKAVTVEAGMIALRRDGKIEVQRTMLELLNQLDGFSSDVRIKVIAATNRPDILDPALLRSGRIDRKVECPLPNELARERILQIHAMKMNTHQDVNFKELARCCEDFNGAQMKAVAVEAGMIALRRDGKILMHEDFMEGITIVNAKKKSDLNYYA